MSLIEIRRGGSTTGLSGAMPFGVLSRRAAMLGAFSIAGLGVPIPKPAVAHAAIVGAASTASADSNLIALADRIVALNRRCEAVVDHQATLEDRVFERCPAPNPLPEPPVRNLPTAVDTPTCRIITVVQPFEHDPAWVEWEKATAAARVGHVQRRRQVEARLGLPEVRRRWARMDNRRDRWAADLAAMRPTTAAGLASKASAMLALMGPDWMAQDDAAERHGILLSAVLADAVRLGTGASHA